MVSELLTLEGDWIDGPESPYGEYIPNEVTVFFKSTGILRYRGKIIDLNEKKRKIKWYITFQFHVKQARNSLTIFHSIKITCCIILC